jgi:ceramide glucosyltransferase
MDLAHSLPDAAALIKSLCDVCLTTAFLGCILMLAESALVIGFRGGQARGAPPQSPVTVLKPLHGAEPGLTERLAAFCRQDYDGPVQILCGAQDRAAPAVSVVEGMRRQSSEQAIELYVDSRGQGGNPKVSNLINMMPRVRHDTLVLSDSDIIVPPDYLRTVIALLSPPQVGAVTCLYHGVGGDGMWERLSALAINSHFLPQAITAIALKATKPCFGATIAMRRSTLERIGGFGRFADELADDYAIGNALQSAGYDLVAAPLLVGHRCFEQSLHELFQHQMRVARTIKSIDPIGYAGTILTHPWPLALIGLFSGSTAAALIAVAALASRVTLYRCVERRFGLRHENYWLIPVQDIIAFGVYVASYFGATVHWRGADYRVTAEGTLIEEDLGQS